MQETRRFKPSTVSRRFSVTAGFYRTCVIDGILEHSPAEHVRRPKVAAESPTLGFTHLQFEALLTAARQSPDPCDFALVAMLGLLGLRIFEATSANIADLGEEHGHRVLRVCGKGTKIVLVPLPPAVGRAIDRAAADRTHGPVLLNSRGTRMDGHAATRRLRRLAATAGIQAGRAHPHMLGHSFVTTMQASTCAMSRSPPVTPTRAPRCATTGPARAWTATRTTSSPPSWHPAPDPACVSRSPGRGRRTALPMSGYSTLAQLCVRLHAANVRQLATRGPSWLKLVHTSAAAGDGFENSAEVVGLGSAAVMICRLASVHLLAASAANTIVTPPTHRAR